MNLDNNSLGITSRQRCNRSFYAGSVDKGAMGRLSWKRVSVNSELQN